jgi:hypothetical protein
MNEIGIELIHISFTKASVLRSDLIIFFISLMQLARKMQGYSFQSTNPDIILLLLSFTESFNQPLW